MRLPSRIEIHDAPGLVEVYPIKREEFIKGSMRWRTKDRAPEITVDADLKDWDAEETLFHEILHCCEVEAQKAGEADRIPESWVEAVGRRLYWTLRRNGFWKNPESPQLELIDDVEPVSYRQQALEAKHQLQSILRAVDTTYHFIKDNPIEG